MLKVFVLLIHYFSLMRANLYMQLIFEEAKCNNSYLVINRYWINAVWAFLKTYIAAKYFKGIIITTHYYTLEFVLA